MYMQNRIYKLRNTLFVIFILTEIPLYAHGVSLTFFNHFICLALSVPTFFMIIKELPSKMNVFIKALIGISTAILTFVFYCIISTIIMVFMG